MPPASSSEQVSWSMFVAAHRTQVPRHRSCDDRGRILVFTPDAEVRRWVEHETFGESATTKFVDAIADIVTSLTLVPPPWPRFLIVDADAISSHDVAELSAIREAGWLGSVIAVGDTSNAIHRALGIDIILPRTLHCELLRNTLKQLGSVTVPMQRVVR